MNGQEKNKREEAFYAQAFLGYEPAIGTVWNMFKSWGESGSVFQGDFLNMTDGPSSIIDHAAVIPESHTSDMWLYGFFNLDFRENSRGTWTHT